MKLLDAIPEGAVVTVDAAPIIYVLDGHKKLGPAYAPLFQAVEEGRNAIVISTITIAQVIAGPLSARNTALAERYRMALTSSTGWSTQDVTVDVAERAARLRVDHGLRLPDAIQLATALLSGSHALVTHDRDFSSVAVLPILSAA
ncbi:MAG: type II toxin-antitoxin system VapC family toxin [Myxococcota bacterium]